MTRTKIKGTFLSRSKQDRMKKMHEAAANQGAVPTADASAIEAAFRRAEEGRALRGGAASPTGDGASGAATTATAASAASAAESSSEAGDGDGPSAVDASDVLLFAMVAGGGGQAATATAERERAIAARAAERERLELEPGRKVAAFLFGALDRGTPPPLLLAQASRLNPINGQRYFVYSSNPARAVAGSVARDDLAGAQSASEGSSVPAGGSALCRWAIWTRDVGYEVHRYPYPSEAAARAQFNRWVYVRVLTGPNHAEVAWSAGWHAAPDAPLRDIRDAIAKNK
jgi:hypothetical protein